MKLSTWSWMLSLQSYVILGVVRRSELPVGEMPGVLLLVLSLLSAVAGMVLGIVSWRRKEGNAWWAIAAVLFNIAMALGVSFVWGS